MALFVKSDRLIALAIVIALSVCGLFFGLCKVPWIETHPLIGRSMHSVEYWVWDRPKDIPGGSVYKFDSVGMLRQIGELAISFLICGGLMIIIWRWKFPTKGHCPKCDYDLRGTVTSGCPECGWGRKEGAQRPK